MAAAQSLFSTMLVFVVVVALGFLHAKAVSADTAYPIEWTVPPNLRVLSELITEETLAQITDKVAVVTIEVGDILHFRYNNIESNLLEVTESEVKECNSSVPLREWTDGDTYISFWEEGVYFYISSIPGPCLANQRLAVKVIAHGAKELGSSQTMNLHPRLAVSVSTNDNCGDLSNPCYNHAPPAFQLSHFWILPLLALSSFFL